MAYDPNRTFVNMSEGNQDLAKYGDAQRNKYFGGRTDQQLSADETTAGGSHAKYDRYGRLIEESSANQEADYYRQQAEASQLRQGAQIDNTQSNEDRAGFAAQMALSGQDHARQNAAYQQQMASTGMYRDMAQGKGPSLAQAMLGQNMNALRAQQASAAASARGPAGLAMAQQNAAGNMAAQGQIMAGQMGQIRAQEQLGAMQGYAQGTQALSGAAGQMRAQDQSGAGLYNQARGLSQQNAQAQANLQQNQNALNDARDQNREQMRQTLFQNGVTNSLARAASDRQGYLIAQGEHDKDNAETAAIIGGGAAAVGSVLGFVGGGPAGAAAGGAAGSKVGDAVNSDMRNKQGITRIGTDFSSGFGDGTKLRSSFGKEDPAPRGGLAQAMFAAPPNPQASYPAGFQTQFDPDASGTGNIIRENPYDLSSDAHSKQQINSLSAALMGERAKGMQNSQGAMYGAPSPIQETLRTTEPYAFNYKPGIGEDPNQRHVGIMAQDLERTPAGATLVKDTAHGKVIDGKQAVGFSLAASADLQRQLDQLKAQQAAMYNSESPVGGELRPQGKRHNQGLAQALMAQQ